MKSFSELESEFSKVAVRAEDPGLGASGYLSVAKAETEVSITSAEYFERNADRNGWFELRLRIASGDTVLLHHALMRSSGGIPPDIESKIFPNVLIFGAQRLSSDGRVSSVVFSFAEMRYFFWYHQIEWIGLFKARAGKLKSIKSLREDNPYFEKHGHFDPSAIFVLHQFPRAFRFKIEDRTYSVFPGINQRGLGWGGLTLTPRPFARIDFAEPVSLDNAIDHVRDWKRYFTQVAMEDLPLEGLSVYAKRSRQGADVYLSNLKSHESRQLHPGDIPLNGWDERKKLGRVMQQWLSKQDERKDLRSAIDRVILRSSQGRSVEDIVVLCSAIDGLAELKQSSGLTKQDVETLAAAASGASRRKKIVVDPKRIKSILGGLQHLPLRSKLELLMKRIGSAVPTNLSQRLVPSVLKLRQSGAHGGSITELANLRTAPTAEALLGCCILYDQLTSGLPMEAHPHQRINAMKRSIWALEELDQLDKLAKRPDAK